MKKYTLYAIVGFMWINLGINGMTENLSFSKYADMCNFGIIAKCANTRHSDPEADKYRLKGKNLKQLQDEIHSIVTSIDVAPERQIEKQVDAARLFEHYI